jgi:Peptidase family M28
MTRLRARAIAPLVLAGLLAPRGGQAQSTRADLPLKHRPEPTSAAITPADLMTRLYIFADDSMMGRQVGRVGNMKGTNYIASQIKALGLVPAGDAGTYFQALPYVQRRYTNKSTMRVDGKALAWNSDFLAVPGATAPKPLENAQAIYGGVAGDTANQISAEQAAGKLVILRPAAAGAGRGGFGGRGGRGGRGGGAQSRFAQAAGVATVDLDALSPSARVLINNPPGQCATCRGGGPGQAGATTPASSPTPTPATLRITSATAAKLLGAPVEGLQLGTTGVRASAMLVFSETPVPTYARNVVAVIPGSDPALKGQYVAIGAHNDHIGFNANPVDHDSARAYASQALAKQIQGGELTALTPELAASITVNVDSLHRIRPARKDSISNGADDDGSGSMAVLEIAEALAKAPVKPKRTILFVWHTGEEGGLTGSNYFTNHPTVVRDSIVAQINIDMIGRGSATDIAGGGDDYLGVVGSKRLSTELGEMVASVNEKQKKPLKLDYRFDDPSSWPGYNNIYGRSDHYNYARYGIPIAFFFTGLHQDYHRVTDEPQYIDYTHYSRITNYVRDLLVDVANHPTRPVVDKATPPVP